MSRLLNLHILPLILLIRILNRPSLSSHIRSSPIGNRLSNFLTVKDGCNFLKG
jgi:hypothetical protein